MLSLDPGKRITTTDGLNHSYVSTYHDSKDEPVSQAGRLVYFGHRAVSGLVREQYVYSPLCALRIDLD